MSVVDLLFAVHNHQPVGNFGHVFEESFELCYRPQIEVLESHPGVRVSIHHSGPLLEWIEKNRPKYIDSIGRLAERGQVEILSGGFYEPILSSIPEDDAIGQVVMMNEYTKKRFGFEPRGMWTAERIWDPCLPKIIAMAGLKYTILDDTHFYYAGLEPADMFGYYMTEKHGHTVAVFPIDKTLRYTIPFRLPHESLDYIKRAGAEMGVECVTYGDDGEKFGVWPGTHKWVFEEKWLENFYSALEESRESIRMTHFSEFLEREPARGRIYLPMASYEEMMEWALPAGAGARFERTLGEIERMGKKDEWKPFIRGGLWDNFLSKYDESNRMHKKMLYVSGKVAAEKRKSAEKKVRSARRALYRGQCNCAYWHGLFGGLYLNYLRHAVYENLIEAENIIDSLSRKGGEWMEAERLDYDMDGGEDVVLKNPQVTACFDPDYGGSMIEFDYRPAKFSLTNTLTRKTEAYHEKIINNAAEAGGAGGQPASIHDIVKFKEPDLAGFLRYDRYLRRSFLDHFIGADTGMSAFRDGEHEKLGDFAGECYTIESVRKTKGKTSLALSRDGELRTGGGLACISVSKTFTINGKDPEVAVRYRVTNKGDLSVECVMGVELNLTLLAGNADDRYWLVDGERAGRTLNETGEDEGVRSIGMRDDFFGFQVNITGDSPFGAWRFPVETVSQSEDGFERTYQGSCVVVRRRLSIVAGGSFEFGVGLSVEKTK